MRLFADQSIRPDFGRRALASPTNARLILRIIIHAGLALSLVAASAVGPATLAAQRPTTQAWQLPAATRDSLRARLTTMVDSGNVAPLSLAVSKGGKIIWEDARLVPPPHMRGAPVLSSIARAGESDDFGLQGLRDGREAEGNQRPNRFQASIHHGQVRGPGLSRLEGISFSSYLAYRPHGWCPWCWE